MFDQLPLLVGKILHAMGEVDFVHSYGKENDSYAKRRVCHITHFY